MWDWSRLSKQVKVSIFKVINQANTKRNAKKSIVNPHCRENRNVKSSRRKRKPNAIIVARQNKSQKTALSKQKTIYKNWERRKKHVSLESQRRQHSQEWRKIYLRSNHYAWNLGKARAWVIKYQRIHPWHIQIKSLGLELKSQLFGKTSFIFASPSNETETEVHKNDKRISQQPLVRKMKVMHTTDTTYTKLQVQKENVVCPPGKITVWKLKI